MRGPMIFGVDLIVAAIIGSGLGGVLEAGIHRGDVLLRRHVFGELIRFWHKICVSEEGTLSICKFLKFNVIVIISWVVVDLKSYSIFSLMNLCDI